MAEVAYAGSAMIGNRLLDWAALAVSLFNAILLAWLGLTVLLNSDRRRWGIWVAGGGMLLGAAFFTSHSALIGLGLINLGWDALIFWWSVGLISAITLPFLWYVVMLWYAGYWEDRRSSLHSRQRPWLILSACLLILGVVGIITATLSLGVDSPRFGQWFLFLRFSETGIPVLVLGFSFYMLLSITLALDTLRHPGPSRRVMGQLARRRARPWLAGASVALFFVALIVTVTLFWVGQLSRELLFGEVYQKAGPALGLVDLLVSLLIGIVIILLGQAIVSYEVFTGRTLPRGGLRRQWQRAILLAAGTSALVSAAVTLALRPIYGLLLAALLMSFFYALTGWRSYVERERLMLSIRPFVTSQGLYDRLLTKVDQDGSDLAAPFDALCRDVLGAQRAYLVATGPLATFVERPLLYPPGREVVLPPLQTLLHRFDAVQTEPLAVDPGKYDGALWAIPLWSERGLAGVLLLGEKRGGGLYTQEEMEIAAITAERLLDMQAGAEMSRRLMVLQRQQMVQKQVVDQQTRRVLHDEILPDLHAAMISLSGSEAKGTGENEVLLALLGGTHRQISDLLLELPAITAPEVERLGLLPALRRMVEEEYVAAFDTINWQVEDGTVELLDGLDGLSAGVIYYAAREVVRNAARHGRDPAVQERYILTITVRACREQDAILFNGGNEVQIAIEDNGQGVLVEQKPANNGGQGLALHSTMMAVIGGTLVVTSVEGEYTRVVLAFAS